MLDRILQSFTALWSSNWGMLTAEAMALLSSLATIALILIAVGWLASGEDWAMAALFTAGQFTFLVVVITNLQWIVDQFVSSFVWAGLTASGSQLSADQFIRPSGIFLMGEQASTPVVLYVNNMRGYFSTLSNSAHIFLYMIFLLVIWVAFWLMAVHVMLAVIELQILTIMSLFLLPWAATPYTSEIAMGTFHRLFWSCVYLGFLALVSGATLPVYIMLAAPDLDVSAWQTALSIAGGAAVLALINWKIPGIIGPRTFTASAFLQMSAAMSFGASRLLRW